MVYIFLNEKVFMVVIDYYLKKNTHFKQVYKNN